MRAGSKGLSLRPARSAVELAREIKIVERERGHRDGDGEKGREAVKPRESREWLEAERELALEQELQAEEPYRADAERADGRGVGSAKYPDRRRG